MLQANKRSGLWHSSGAAKWGVSQLSTDIEQIDDTVTNLMTQVTVIGKNVNDTQV